MSEDKMSRDLFVLLVIGWCVGNLAMVPASALSVGGSILRAEIGPGQTLVHRMTVTNEVPATITVAVMGFGQDPNMAYIPLDINSDTGPYSARPFVTIDKPRLTLSPQSLSATVNATITVPPNVGDGGRYAIIQIQTSPQGSGSTAFVTEINVPILLTIAGSKIVETGTITDLQVSEALAGESAYVFTTLKNTGNHHYYSTYNTIDIRNVSGKEIVNITSSPSIFAIIPLQTVQYKTRITSPLSAGTYEVSSQIRLGNGRLLDTRETGFEVRNAYIPPFQEGSISLNPKTTGELITSDGSVVIHFPAGAVLGTTQVSIRAVSPNRLPTPPSGAKVGITAFSIEGFTGLLKKEATMVVQYRPKDLEAAGGDAAKLVLARWEVDENRWTLLPTAVDPATKTLTVSTNQFSTWAILATAQAPSGTAQTTQTPGMTTLLAVGALILVTYVMQRRIERKR